MLELTELGINILRFQTGCKGKVNEGFASLRFVFVPIKERIVLDRLVVSTRPPPARRNSLIKDSSQGEQTKLRIDW